MTISENFTPSNNFKVTSTKAWAEGFNYVNVGQKFKVPDGMVSIGTSGFDIDLYCAEAEFSGNSYVQYGNMYVYSDASYSGNLTVNSDNVVINGNLYVEGNLIINNTNNPVKVTGNVYVKGSISGGGTLSVGGTTNKGASVIFSKTGRDAKPVIPAKSDEYVYYPEDFLKSTDTNITTISSTYANFYSGVNINTKTFKTFADAYPGGYELNDAGTVSKYNFMVNESCTWSDDLDFNTQGDKTKILINVTNTSGDIVIRLANGLSMGAKWSPTVIVKNDSDIDTKSGDHKYNCYFVSDAGNDIKLNGLGADGKSQHSDAIVCTYSFEHLVVLDYQMYIRMYDSNTISNLKVSHETLSNSSFILNPTSVADATIGVGSYSPESNSIIFLLTEGTTFKATNCSLIQGCIYAPQAEVNIATSGPTMDTTDSSGNILTVQVCNIGVMIASNFGNDNKAFYIFNEPSETSVLSKAKGVGDETAYGYTLKRYDHY